MGSQIIANASSEAFCSAHESATQEHYTREVPRTSKSSEAVRGRKMEHVSHGPEVAKAVINMPSLTTMMWKLQAAFHGPTPSAVVPKSAMSLNGPKAVTEMFNVKRKKSNRGLPRFNSVYFPEPTSRRGVILHQSGGGRLGCFPKRLVFLILAHASAHSCWLYLAGRYQRLCIVSSRRFLALDSPGYPLSAIGPFSGALVSR